MRKVFTLFTFLFLIGYLAVAQHIDLKQVIPVAYQGISGHVSPNGSCDSLNLFDANSWSAYYYEYRGGGTVLGTNNLKATKDATVLEDANYFDASGSNYNYLTGALVYFSFANSDVPANLNKDIILKVYTEEGNAPGTLLGSASLTLAQVHQDVLAGKLTEFILSTPITLPASKKFFVAIDHSNFSWSFKNHDTISIVATANHTTENTSFQYINVNSVPQWYPVNKFWKNSTDSLDVTLFAFPFVSTSLNSCTVLPVNIFNLGGTIKNYQAYLNWSTATESNNKGFYVERSKDGQNFTSLDFVNGAGNSSQITNYTYADVTLKDINVTTTYYRLKQIDVDGKYAYSNVLSLNLKDVAQWRVYPNPAKDIATVEINLETSSKVNVQVISRDGRIILNSNKGILNQGKQQVSINTQSFAKGSYIVRLTIGDKHFSLPMVKE